MVITRVNAKEITSDEKWGAGPVCVEGVPATVTLPVATSRLKCFALDPHGNRKQELAVEQAEGGGARIVLKPEYATVWYELDVK